MDADRSKERAAQQHLLRSLGWSGVDPEAPLLALGLVSVDAAALSHTISEVFGKRPSADRLLSHPSIEALARFAAGGELEDAPTSADDVFLIGNGALRIREACLADVPHLARLEALSWPAPLAGLTAAQISARIERFAAGQLVLLEGSQVVGSLFTQRISSVSELTGGTVDFRNALSLHTDTGAVWQLLSVQVLPSHGSRGLGDMLVNYGLTVARATPGVHRAAAVTRCRTWSAGGNVSRVALGYGDGPRHQFSHRPRRIGRRRARGLARRRRRQPWARRAGGVRAAALPTGGRFGVHSLFKAQFCVGTRHSIHHGRVERMHDSQCGFKRWLSDMAAWFCTCGNALSQSHRPQHHAEDTRYHH